MLRGDVEAAAAHFFEACSLRRRVDAEADTPAEHPLLAAAAGDQSFLRVGRLKLRHDAEQLEYLVSLSKLPAVPYLKVAKVFRSVIQHLPMQHVAVDVQPGIHKSFDRLYNRVLHMPRPGRSPTPVLNPTFDATAFERRFRQEELAPEAEGCEAQNGITFADGILSDDALDALHRWCLESTMWFATRSGYLAAFMQDAFNAPLVVQLTEELRKALPSILGSHQLMNMWGFKYANNASDWPLAGTAVHADIAAVNVNMWITEDEANEDPDGGGLIIYKKQAPREWGFMDYNSLEQVPRLRAYLNDSERVVVPHRRNRVVVFNSNLFHETQTPRFRPGYTNRRINLTFLFGRRCGGAANEARGSSLERPSQASTFAAAGGGPPAPPAGGGEAPKRKRRRKAGKEGQGPQRRTTQQGEL